MRFVVLSNRIRCLNQVAAIGLMSVIGAGCSSDFARFDAEEYTASIVPLQTAQLSRQPVDNPYPGDVDPRVTASISQNGLARSRFAPPPAPGGYVDGTTQPQPLIRRAPLAKPLSASRVPASQNAATYNTYNTYNSYQTPTRAPSNLKAKYKANAPVLKRAAKRPSYVDPITTSALKPARAASVKKSVIRTKNTIKPFTQQSVTSGWTGIGGTSITVRDGETLYNISKRYGVPVNELMKVNKLSSADRVSAGQRIIIPTYIYSANVPVSAPDNNPKTRASRSSRGMIGEVAQSNIIVPTKSPNRYKPGLAPMSVARRDTDRSQAKSVTQYSVVSGDTLGAIAKHNRVNVSDLKRANGLKTSSIRVGQRLTIPGNSAYQSNTNTKVGLAPMRVDKRITGSTPKPYVKPGAQSSLRKGDIEEKAPARTGIETFRWPATGKVSSKFGQRRRGTRNDGIDILVPEGTSVKAAENGVVIYSDSELKDYGNLLLIRHADGWVSAYAHNKSLNVKRGDKVRRGQVVARSGRTGNTERPMIHFELRKDSNPVNPQKYLR